MANANPAMGPVYIAKYYLSDGFYRLRLTIESAAALTIILPQREGEDQLVAMPLVLPMGWTQSPPSFLAATETIANLANTTLAKNTQLPIHRLEHWVLPPPDMPKPPHSTTDIEPMLGPITPCVVSHHKLSQADAYVDDIIGLAQGEEECRTRITRAILHSLDTVLRPLEDEDPPDQQEPISHKKLTQGNRYMHVVKEVLGWTLDGERMEVRITERHLACLKELLASFPRARK